MAEGDEIFAQFIDGNQENPMEFQKVVGEKHGANGGVKFAGKQGFFLSDSNEEDMKPSQELIDFANSLIGDRSKKHMMNVDDSYASGFSKVLNATGYERLNEVIAERTEKIISEQEKGSDNKGIPHDEATRTKNIDHHGGIISRANEQKNILAPGLTEAFNEFYNKQELSKKQNQPVGHLALAAKGGEVVQIPIFVKGGNVFTKKGYEKDLLVYAKQNGGLKNIINHYKNGGSTYNPREYDMMQQSIQMTMPQMPNTFFEEGGPSWYKDKSENFKQRFEENLRKMFKYEGTKGGVRKDASGNPIAYGLGNFGINSAMFGKFDTEEEAIEFVLDKMLEKVPEYFRKDITADTLSEVTDFIFNTGRDPRIYMLDEYLKKTTGKGIENRPDFNADMWKNPDEFEETQEEFEKLWNKHKHELEVLDNKSRRDYLNQGRDDYYQSINREDGKPSAAYDLTHKGRVGLYQEGLPFEETNISNVTQGVYTSYPEGDVASDPEITTGDDTYQSLIDIEGHAFHLEDPGLIKHMGDIGLDEFGKQWASGVDPNIQKEMPIKSIRDLDTPEKITRYQELFNKYNPGAKIKVDGKLGEQTIRTVRSLEAAPPQDQTQTGQTQTDQTQTGQTPQGGWQPQDPMQAAQTMGAGMYPGFLGTQPPPIHHVKPLGLLDTAFTAPDLIEVDPRMVSPRAALEQNAQAYSTIANNLVGMRGPELAANLAAAQAMRFDADNKAINAANVQNAALAERTSLANAQARQNYDINLMNAITSYDEKTKRAIDTTHQNLINWAYSVSRDRRRDWSEQVALQTQSAFSDNFGVSTSGQIIYTGDRSGIFPGTKSEAVGIGYPTTSSYREAYDKTKGREMAKKDVEEGS